MNLRRIAQPGALALVAALALAGCSSDAEGDDAGEAPTTAGDPAAAPQAPGEGWGGRDAGGVSGLVAAVSDGVVQVQEADSQTAVTWSDSTQFRREATITLDAVPVGSCVVAMLPGEDSGAAAMVAVSAADEGDCAAGLGGAAGGPRGGFPVAPPDGAAMPPEGDGTPPGLPEGAPTDMPEGELPQMPEGAPSGAVGGFGGFGSIVAGRVTAVDATTLTVETTGTDGATTSQAVEVSGDTVVTSTVEADASALVVGVCADVQGESDTSGGMAASRITVSDAGDEGCWRGFGPGGGWPAGIPGGDATDA